MQSLFDKLVKEANSNKNPKTSVLKEVVEGLQGYEGCEKAIRILKKDLKLVKENGNPPRKAAVHAAIEELAA